MVIAGIHVSWRWLTLVVRGLVAMAAGIAAFTISVDTAKSLLVGYFLVDGVLALIFALRLTVPLPSRLLIGIDGIIDLVVAGLLLAFAPGVSLLILVVALWAIATGVLEVAAAIFISRTPMLSWAIALAGVTSCAVGIVLIDLKSLAEIGLLYAFAAYAITAGALFLTFGLVLWRAFHRVRS